MVFVPSLPHTVSVYLTPAGAWLLSQPQWCLTLWISLKDQRHLLSGVKSRAVLFAIDSNVAVYSNWENLQTVTAHLSLSLKTYGCLWVYDHM